MNWIQYTDTRFPRATVWCLSTDLQAGATDGTYNFVDTKFEQNDVGDGTDIIVMDSGKLLFYSKENHVAYEFGSSGSDSGGDDDDVPEGYIVIAPKQSVTLTGSEETLVQLTTVEGYEVENIIPENLLVKVNDAVLTYDGENYDYRYTGDSITYLVSAFTPEDSLDNKIGFIAFVGVGQAAAGTYEVAIYAPEDSGGGGDEPKQ